MLKHSHVMYILFNLLYIALGQTSCSDCPAGSSCLPPSQVTTCTAGYYSALQMSNCSRCAEGTYADSPGRFYVIYSLVSLPSNTWFKK